MKKPISSAEHLQKLMKIKRDSEINSYDDPKIPKVVMDKIKENFETRKNMVEKYKEDKKNKVPGAKLGNADRGKAKEKLKDDTVKENNGKTPKNDKPKK